MLGPSQAGFGPSAAGRKRRLEHGTSTPRNPFGKMLFQQNRISSSPSEAHRPSSAGRNATDFEKKTARPREDNAFTVLAVFPAFAILADLTVQESLEDKPESKLCQPGLVPLGDYNPVKIIRSRSRIRDGALFDSELRAVEEIEKLRLELE
jgi:hypothetical protein